jgi:hypothetical protein
MYGTFTTTELDRLASILEVALSEAKAKGDVVRGAIICKGIDSVYNASNIPSGPDHWPEWVREGQHHV